MLVECGKCGAPLEVPQGSRVATCKYCDSKQVVGKMQTLAMQTPPGWAPPPTWTPPAHVPHAQVAPAKVLVYHEPKKAGGGSSAGCVLLLVLGIASFAVVRSVGIDRVLALFGHHVTEPPPTLSPVLTVARGTVLRRTFRGTTSGEGEKTLTGQYCTFGTFPAAPHLSIRTAHASAITLSAMSRDDLTLGVLLPNGETICDDDSGDGNQPRVTTAVPPGVTHVWVGHRHEGMAFDVNLEVREIAGVPDARGLVAAGPPSAGTFDLSKLPRDGRVVVRFEPSVELSSLCHAHTSIVPALILTSRERRAVTLRASGVGSVDPVLVTRNAAGAFRCDDDSGHSRDALLRDEVGPGALAVWVGTTVDAATSDVAVQIDALPVGVFPDPVLGIAPDAPPAWNTVDLDALAATQPVSPRGRAARSGTEVSVRGDMRPDTETSALGSSCRGTVSIQPSVRLTTRTRRRVTLTTSGRGDLVLVTRVGSTYVCDDDSGGRQMARVTLDLEPGSYPVWIGAYSGALPSAALAIRLQP